MTQMLIGIGGRRNAGKDTVASMINYITHVGVAKANYRDWATMHAGIDKKCEFKIVHFADALKQCVSIIYNIDITKLNDRFFKDYMWYCLEERRFIDEKSSSISRYNKILITDLKTDTLANILRRNIGHSIIKLRTLLQYFGTNLCRYNLGSKIWVKSAIMKAHDIALDYNICIMPDVRFEEEADAIHRSSLYGVVIRIDRESCEKDEHESENINFPFDYGIDNNGSLTQLFYRVLQIMQELNSI